MMMTTITEIQARALAELVHQLRPEWDPQGIVTALHAARERGTSIDVCIAAIRAAVEPTNRTPAVIKYDGPHWRAAAPVAAPRTPTGRRICPRCRDPHDVSTACTSPPPGAIDRDSPARVAAKTAARLALHREPLDGDLGDRTTVPSTAPAPDPESRS